VYLTFFHRKGCSGRYYHKSYCSALTSLAISEKDLETPFLALRAYYQEAKNQRMVSFVQKLGEEKLFDMISWEDLLKYTPEKCDLLDPFLGPTLHRIFRSLLGIIVCYFITNNKQKKRGC
jgi:hypothetical protein